LISLPPCQLTIEITRKGGTVRTWHCEKRIVGFRHMFTGLFIAGVEVKAEHGQATIGQKHGTQ
jgi:hypothetical protein